MIISTLRRSETRYHNQTLLLPHLAALRLVAPFNTRFCCLLTTQPQCTKNINKPSAFSSQLNHNILQIWIHPHLLQRNSTTILYKYEYTFIFFSTTQPRSTKIWTHPHLFQHNSTTIYYKYEYTFIFFITTQPRSTKIWIHPQLFHHNSITIH